MGIMKTIHVRYSSLLQEQRGLNEETVQTEAENAASLFDELSKHHGFRYGCGMFKVVINDDMRSLTSLLADGDTVEFLPPLAGG